MQRSTEGQLEKHITFDMPRACKTGKILLIRVESVLVFFHRLGLFSFLGFFFFFLALFVFFCFIKLTCLKVISPAFGFFVWFSLVWFFETRSLYTDRMASNSEILLPLPPECWN